MAEEDFDIGALLGGPIRAIQEAQIAAEREYMAFLLDYGLEEITTKVGNKQVKSLKLREISFGMTRSIGDPSAPGEVIETQAEIRAPLLSLVQMPAVGIETATIELDLDVTTQSEEKATAPQPSRDRFLPASRVAAPVIKGAVANSATNRNFRTHGKLSVKMNLRATHDDDLHGRLSRIVGDGLAALVNVPDK